jgi:CBS domain-containing protein
MKASEVMSRDVITVDPATPIHRIATLMTERRISGVPVIMPDGKVVGVVSESDLIYRAEMGTERKRKWWLAIFSDPDELARDYAKAHGVKAEDVMTREVVFVTEDDDISHVANTLDRHRVKRLPVVRDGKLVGIITRSDLVKALSRVAPPPVASASDAAIDKQLMERMRDQDWLTINFIHTVVQDGVVQLNGFVATADQRRALRVLVEETPGVRGVDDRLVIGLPTVRAY